MVFKHLITVLSIIEENINVRKEEEISNVSGRINASESHTVRPKLLEGRNSFWIKMNCLFISVKHCVIAVSLENVPCILRFENVGLFFNILLYYRQRNTG